MSIFSRTDKQAEISTDNRILFSNKKEQTTETCYNVEKLQKLYAEWKKPDVNEYLPYDQYIWSSTVGRLTCGETKPIQDCLWDGGVRRD